MIPVEEMKKKRFQFLHTLYVLTGGNELKWFNMFDIGKSLEFDRELIIKIAQYLKGEGLIQFQALGGIIGITHSGIREVEQALSNPGQPTYYFPPVNVISIGQMVDSQIQQASPAAKQEIGISETRYEELKEVIETLNKSIDQLDLKTQQKSDLQAEIQTIDAQMTSSKPKATIITECLSSIRRILEGTAINIIAPTLLSQIVALLGG